MKPASQVYTPLVRQRVMSGELPRLIRMGIAFEHQMFETPRVGKLWTSKKYGEDWRSVAEGGVRIWDSQGEDVRAPGENWLVSNFDQHPSTVAFGVIFMVRPPRKSRFRKNLGPRSDGSFRVVETRRWWVPGIHDKELEETYFTRTLRESPLDAGREADQLAKLWAETRRLDEEVEQEGELHDRIF